MASDEAAPRSSRRPSFLLSNLGSIGAHLEAAQVATQAGATRLWLPETRGPDALVTAAAIGATTSVELGTAIVPVSTRTPAVLAMAATDLTRLTGRPVHLGIGAGGQVIVERWHGAPFDRSVDRVADALAILRQALAGERTDHEGLVQSSDGLRLTVPPAAPVLLYVGGMGPRMTELAARSADGLILTWLTTDVVAERARRLAEEAAANGREVPRLVARLYVAVTDDPTAAREGVRQELVEYVASPPYARYFRSIGFGDEADAVADAFRVGDRAASLAAISDRMLDALLVAGPASACAARVREAFDAGADDVMVQPVPHERGGDQLTTIEALANPS